MRSRRLALGIVPAIPLALCAAFGACSREPARIGLVMRTPQGLLDGATNVELWVFPAELSTCDQNGHVNGIPTEAGEKFRLDRSGCPAGVSWCRDITLEQGDAPQMFAVTASDPGGTIAEGCTIATVDQDPLEVTIKMQRYNPPACCNDGKLQAGEQCDSSVAAELACDGSAGGSCRGIVADAVCACDCRANEILISVDSTEPPALKNLPARSKSRLAMAFTPGSSKFPNALRAVYQTENTGKASKADIAIRFLSKDLYPIEDPVSLSRQLLLPLGCASITEGGILQTQDFPSITQIGADATGIVYTSDEAVAETFDVWLVIHSTSGCREECAPSDGDCLARQSPLQLSRSTEAPGAKDPDVAGGPGSSALAVWTRNERVLGRIARSDAQLLPTDGEIEIAVSGRHARVAGGATGWLVVYEGAGSGDADGIFAKTVDADGNVGDEIRINSRVDGAQDQPDVAMLDDGRAIVVWRNDGDVFFQRFDPAHTAVQGDQTAPLNTAFDGEQARPAVAASVGFGEFFAVAWENVGSGEIGARLIDGSEGFLFNSVTGQNGDFVASHPDIQGTRRMPAVAIGGGGYVAIGWQDDSDEHPGIYVRRFPLPPAR